MKFTSSRKEFVDAVQAAAAASSSRSSVQILMHLRITAGEGEVKVMGCDGEMWIERTFPAMVEEPGQTCVPTKFLSDIVRNFSDGDVSLSTTENGALVSQNASEYTLSTLGAEDFPPRPDFGGESELTLPLNELRDAVDSILFAVSGDVHRPILTGVLFIYDGTTLTLVSTDTHRLAVRKLAKPGIGDAIEAVVPERALRAMKDLPVAADEPVTLRIGGRRIGVSSPNATIVCQLIDGVYPNWNRVVPSETSRTWTLETDKLQANVKRAMVVAKDSANRLRFSGEGESLTILARSDEGREAKEPLEMVADNGDVEIAFNGAYVLDALGAIHGPGVRIEMTEPTRPAVVRPVDDEKDYFCVIMPMSLT